MSVLTHEKGGIRKQGATHRRRPTAFVRDGDAAGEHLEAAQLMFAVVAERATAAGSRRCVRGRRSSGSRRRRGSAVSHALESQVLNNPRLSDGGISYSSPEHTECSRGSRRQGHI